MLALPDPDAIEPDRPFTDLGVDSLTAVELRNCLAAQTGLSLPATLAFDQPSPTTLARHLAGLFSGSPAPTLAVSAAGRTEEPVAVVGMACRFPGGVDSAAGLWDLVFSGTDAVGAFPGDRGWDVAGLFDPDPDAVGKTYTRHGGFVAEAGGFDAEFFGISAREALAMDPQQRLLVEVCWEALEAAGIDPATLAGTDTGVFAGAWAQAYGTANSNTAEGFAMTGAATSVASGRVAYVLGLQGPAITVDTACSSSLVATHLACQSLRNGESGLALAGGVTVMATPTVFVEFARQRGLAADGRCKAFAAAADGTGWGEGAAVVVLERLSDAHANRHPVLAVIAGSAVNQDGASNGLTAPNGPAQQRVIRQAAANAGVGLDRVDVVEAHGTGTTLGDPVEAGALIATYGAARDRERPLWLGSVKSNIGHTQAAAGAAGIIKMVLALQHGVLPATLHVDAPSPHIDWSAGTVRLLTEPVAWPVNGHPRTAAVSSFGISGTNAHLILQQAPPAPVPVPVAAPADDPPLLGIWPVSARTPTALAAQADRLREHLDDHPDLDLTDLAYSLASTRTHHPYRAAITVGADSTDPRADLLEALAALGADRPHPGVSRRQVSGQSAKTVFVFPGQGGQYPAMGAQLYDRHPGFADAVDQCDAALHPWTGWSVRDVLRGDPAAPPLDRVDVVQPVLFAVMVALAETLAGYGIVPDAVIGHSQGEIAAAHIAGALSLQDAATVVALRGRALARLSGTGAMASVLAGAADLAPRLAPFGQQLSIAAINGPTQTILSGQPAAVARFVADCAREGLQVRSLAVDYASHSPQIDPLRDQLLTELAGLAPAPARIPLYSTVAGASSGDPLDTTTMDAAYWYANLREPVAFHDTIAAMSAAGHHRFVELSPHPVLAAAISDTLAEASRGSAVIATLHRDRPDLDTLASTLAGLHTHGHSPSWERLYPHANIVGLPTYPFEHRRYWLAPTPAGEVDAAGLGLTRAEHPLLGALTELADQDQVVLSGRLSLTTHPWLTGHHVHDTAVFPGTGFLDLILRAGQCAGCPVIDELVLHTPLVLADTPTDVQITVHPHQAGGRRPFTWHARTSDRVSADWTLHATGVLSDDPTRPAAPGAPAPGVPALDVDDFYARLATHGLSYRDPFRAVHGIGVDPAHPEIIHAEAALPAGTDVTGYGIHPALLDAALHPLAAMLVDRAGEATTPRLPFTFTGVRLHATDATHLQIRLTTIGADTFSLSATDPAGAPVLDIDTVVVRELSGRLSEHTPMTGTHDGVLELAWSPLPQTAPPAGADLADWVVVSGDPEQLPAALRHRPIHTDLAQVDPSRTDAAVWVVPPPPTPDTDPLRRIHTLTRDAVTQLQGWLSRTDTTETRLVVLTRHAVSVSVHDRAPDLAHAALWALLHSAHNEHPDRITLLDTDDTSTTGDALPGLLARGLATEPQLAIRHGIAYLPRLARTVALTPPQSPYWQLASTGRGDLANLRLLPTNAPAALGPGQIQVAVRAAGLNFHDVVVALGAITDEGLGGEAAGIVIDTAADVASLRPGDAVMGLFPNNAFAPTAITDEHRVLAIPAGWSFHAAASVPVAFLTAYLALVEIGGLGAGQNVLIHAGAGGVGQAAIQIAGHLGAEVFATAHPTKHGVLEKIGVHHRRIASSRSLDYVEAFRRQTGGRGVDVVLNCLTGDYIDASLDLLGPGGRFVEIGKTDIRVPADISAAHPGVTYHPCDLGDAPPEQLQRAWTALSGWFTAGACTPLPTTSVALTHAVQAFRDMSQARHTGKIVLTPPTVLDPDGTVLITGGTGMLGVLFAEHLVTKHGARHLVLVSRSGANAAGAGALGRRLAELGAHVSITACDVADPAQLAALVPTVTAERRLTAVIHAAGILDDAVITQLTGEQLDTVLAAKADAAWHLHHLTADHDLDAFVLFSSAAAVLGSPGQANYAAANAVLDALAHHRHRHQLPATSLAWGHWHTPSAMTAHLNTHDHDRLTRALTPITDEHGLALFDAALTRQRPTLITAPLSAPGLARLARHHRLPPLLCALTATLPHAATTNADTLTAQLTGHTTEQQLLTLSALVTATTATVLAHPDPNAIDPDRPFKDLGIDSLTALELRNGLSAHTGLTLPATLVFDHPTPAAVAAHLLGQLSNTAAPTVPTAPAIGRTDEPVAVIGMACRLPGEVNSTAQLWDLVAGGGDAMEPFPGDRGWDLAGLFDPDPDTAGKTYTRYGGFVAQAAGFDAEFFGISAREAQATDPQQRLLLEVCWEALETAGIDPTSLAGTDTGVFAGTWAQPYGATDTAGAETAEGYAITGSVTSVASGRVAYLLGLQGPAITIDTACSSSLVATHLACQSLRNGESTLALAGGVTIMTTPTLFTEFARQRGLAPDGRCKAFAAAADGTGFSEGAAVLVLERLSDAHANQHPVLAVIAGSAVNQDGASNGLTAPHGPAQQRVITQAAANAAISLDQVDVVEAHGTGTTLGDPVEAGALIATYGAARTPDNPLWLGSIKSNIGHTQAAAGAAGIIKMVLALNHGVLPPTLHVDTPSPHIDWTTGTVKLLTEPLAWPANNHPKTAAVSSFGVSGTNAHLILQQAPPTPVAPAPDPPPPAEQPALLGIWPVSARTPAALRAQAARLHEHVADHPGSDLSDVAYSLATTRTHHPYRAVITVGADSEDPRRDLLEALTALSADRPHPGVVRHHQAGQTAKTVFVFPGQGAQYPRMGAQLYDRHPSFARALDECDAALRPYTGWSIRNVLHRDPAAPPLDRVDVTQPALFAVMVALAHTLAGHGITPDAVIGHSQGEIAAAHIAGALSLNDAAKIVALRSHALAHLSGTGAMASVLLPTEDLNPRLAPWSPQLSIAATNGPTHTIVSGDAVAVQRFIAECEHDGLQVRRLAVDYASHCAQIDPLREELLTELAGLTPAPARIPLYSTVASARSGDPLDTTTMNAQYWYANLREPVHFHDTVHELLNAGPHTFVELSPHPVLAPALTDTLAGLSGRTCSAVIPTLHRDRPDLDTLTTALARLHIHGHSPSWRSLYPHANTVGLPTYPFEHRRYWPAPAATVDVSDPAEGRLWKAVNEGALDTVAKTLNIDDAASLGPVVDALRLWRNGLGERSRVSKLRYRIGWQTIVPKTFPLTRRRWLVLAAAEQVDDEWIAGLSTRYADDVDVLAIDPAAVDRTALAAALSGALERTGCEGVVSFVALSAGLMATVLVAQAYGDAGLEAPLWVITRGAVSVGPEEAPSPGQAAVWGLGQSVCLEHPQWWGGLIDVAEAATPRGIEQLYTLLSCPQSEDQLAIRGHGVSVRRLRQAPLPLRRVRSWTASGTAVVTGATGRLGGHIVRWLAAAGASHLVLLSRRAADSPRAAQLQTELGEVGATSSVVSVDVTDHAALAAVVAEIRREHGPISTVVHAAAAVGWHSVADVTEAELASDYAKAVGAENLIELLDDEPSPTFILFSSAAGVWGGARQGCYAAANAHLDALASRLRARGRTAVSVAWGLWADQEEAVAGEIVDYFARLGLNPMTPDVAFSGLQHSLDADDSVITIADVSWNQFLPAFTAWRSHPLLTELAQAYPSALAGAASGATAAVPEALATLLADQSLEHQLDTLTSLVIAVTGAVLAHPDPEAIDPGRPFKGLGIDSLTAVELRNNLAARTGLSLPASLVFDHPTPDAVAHHLAGLLSGGPAPVLAVTTAARTEEPVAVIGMACRFAGGVDSADALWDLVESGTDAVGGFPTDRGWDLAGLFDPDPDAVGKTYTRHGGFVAGVDGFDAEFFGISAREAQAIDPQQRLLVEVCWEAVETAGIDPATLAGTDTGVFAGTWAQPYGATNSECAEGYAMTGSAASVASGRVAYVLGLQGPAITIDTACSSSLVATHLACQSLRNGEAGLALAGGVTIMTTPKPFTEFARQRGLAPDGRCKSFAAAADGTGFGEGAAVLVLERLSDAHRNGHPVLAVIAGSAVNQDGASNGLTAPNGPAQQRVIRQAVANAGLGLDRVDVVEAHGTGTTLGDPVEAGALIATYGAAREREHPLWVGSIKSNIGHTQAAAGAAGLIKMVQAISHDVLPATLHVDRPSPHIDWSAGTVRLLTEPIPWPETGRPKTAAVSSFGISGTNAHLILQQAPPTPVAPGSGPAARTGQPLLRIWPVSARTPAALCAQAERLYEHSD